MEWFSSLIFLLKTWFILCCLLGQLNIGCFSGTSFILKLTWSSSLPGVVGICPALSCTLSSAPRQALGSASKPNISGTRLLHCLLIGVHCGWVTACPSPAAPLPHLLPDMTLDDVRDYERQMHEKTNIKVCHEQQEHSATNPPTLDDIEIHDKASVCLFHCFAPCFIPLQLLVTVLMVLLTCLKMVKLTLVLSKDFFAHPCRY